MGDLLQVFSCADLTALVRTYAGDDCLAVIQRTTSERSFGLSIAADLAECVHWFHEWLEFEGDRIMMEAEDQALDAFVRRHHGPDAEEPPVSGAGGLFQLYASEGWPLVMTDSVESQDIVRPVRTHGWVPSAMSGSSTG